MPPLTEQIYRYSPTWLQNTLISAYGAKVRFQLQGTDFHRLLEQFDKSQWLSREHLIALQNEKLALLIRHAYENVPYYRDVMTERGLTPADITTAADLHKLPLLTRSVLKEQPDRLRARTHSRRMLTAARTGGTTGSPLEVLWDRQVALVNNVVDWRQKTWAGMKFGDRLAAAGGRILVPLNRTHPPFWRTDYVRHLLYLSAFHLSAKNLDSYVQKLRAFKAVALESYPSIAYVIARHLLERRDVLPLTCVLTSSELLTPLQRQTIEKAFACPVFDFYGMAERVIFATECSAHQGHHVNLDYGITEILKPDGQPVEPGTLGRIVATSLHNYGWPLIRYATSDVTIVNEEPCSCGRAFPRMLPVTSRTDDIITTPDGRFISPPSLTHVSRPIDSIAEYQMIQEERDRIHVKLVRGPHYSDDDTRLLLARLHERLGSDMKIEIEFADAIPRTGSGKFRWIISKVPFEA